MLFVVFCIAFGYGYDNHGDNREPKADAKMPKTTTGDDNRQPKKSKPEKPKKPYPDFPLTAHRNGQWVKKIRGKLFYFGRDANSALQKYLEERDCLQAGIDPRKREAGTLTLGELSNRYLHYHKQRMESGQVTYQTWDGLKKEAERMLSVLHRGLAVTDLTPGHFATLKNELIKRYSPTVVKISISRIKSMFAWALIEAELIEMPVRYGKESFKPPAAKAIRQKRNETGKLFFEAEELHQVLNSGRKPFDAMTLLAMNCGFGNSDIANLPISAINFKTGWIDFPRTKTAIERRCPLWKETIQALQEAIATRPEPKNRDDAKLVFLTQPGERWVRVKPKPDGGGTLIDSICREFAKLLKQLELTRNRRNFYALRHTFRTVADGTKDRGAVDFLMGHSPITNDMRPVYVEAIDNERLQAVVEHVHDWLFSDKVTKTN